MTTVRTGPVPAVVPGFTPGATGSWMGDTHFFAFLFYTATNDPTMRAGGQMSQGFATKIFWWIPGGGNTLVIRGVEATSGRSFTQSVDGIGGGSFPSIPVVPSKGCWTLTESVGGRTAGAITIPVIAALGT